MTRAYSWLSGQGVSEVIQPLEPADAVPVGQRMTEAERAAWKALWTDRLALGVQGRGFPVSVLHSSASPCEGTCPNGKHRKADQ